MVFTLFSVGQQRKCSFQKLWIHYADVHEVMCSIQTRREENAQPIVSLFPFKQEMWLPVEDCCVGAGWDTSGCLASTSIHLQVEHMGIHIFSHANTSKINTLPFDIQSAVHTLITPCCIYRHVYSINDRSQRFCTAPCNPQSQFIRPDESALSSLNSVLT